MKMKIMAGVKAAFGGGLAGPVIENETLNSGETGIRHLK